MKPELPDKSTCFTGSMVIVTWPVPSLTRMHLRKHSCWCCRVLFMSYLSEDNIYNLTKGRGKKLCGQSYFFPTMINTSLAIQTNMWGKNFKNPKGNLIPTTQHCLLSFWSASMETFQHPADGILYSYNTRVWKMKGKGEPARW